MGIPDEPFWAPAELVAATRAHAAERGAAARSAWPQRLGGDHRDAEWTAAWAGTGLDGWDDDLPSLRARRVARDPQGDPDGAQRHVRQPARADLGLGRPDRQQRHRARSTASRPRTDPGGRYIHYGVREHAMGSAMVGMAEHGGILPVGGTFFVFSDYMRPPIRLASLSQGEGLLRVHPRLGRRRRGRPDPPARRAARHAAGDPRPARDATGRRQRDRSTRGPTSSATTDRRRLILSRQNIEVTTDGSAVEPGAGIVVDADTPQVVLVGTGSEVAVCVDAAEQLAERPRRPGREPAELGPVRRSRTKRSATSIFPPGVPVLSVEAATTFGWERYADDIDRHRPFRRERAGRIRAGKLGINVGHVVERASALIAAS